MAAYISVIGYLYFHYSGTPYKNKTYATMMKRLLIIYTIWSVSKLPLPIMILSNIYGINEDGSRFDV